jgi:hypothetical protein
MKTETDILKEIEDFKPVNGNWLPLEKLLENLRRVG